MSATIDPRVDIGHVHLKVADLDRAIGFYRDVLGFELTATYGEQAAFLAAGGYHHHLGTNTWAGSGARPAEPQDARLLEWTLELPDTSILSALRESLTRNRYAAEGKNPGAELLTRDPWGTELRFVAGGTGARS